MRISDWSSDVCSSDLFDPLTAKTTDHDWLPNATARFKIGDGIQIRLGYAKSLRRPNFGALNPAVTLNQSNNPLVQSGGSAGNPDLQAQKSQTTAATFEYYFTEGYSSIEGYYQDIPNRLKTTAPATQ